MISTDGIYHEATGRPGSSYQKGFSMAKQTEAEKLKRRAIRDARTIIQKSEKADANEAETRRRIERIFENVMGYDPFVHLSRERAVRGAGETEHVDFSIQIDGNTDSPPIIMVEIKRVAIDLSRKHLKQVTSYAIDAGCEWTLLTNGREWKLYHVAFGQPPESREVQSWNLLVDDLGDLVKSFDLISFRSLKHKSLDELWQKTSILSPRNVLEAIICEQSMNVIRRQLRKKSGVLLKPEEVIDGTKQLLNESAATELSELPIAKPAKTRKRKNNQQPSLVIEVERAPVAITSDAQATVDE